MQIKLKTRKNDSTHPDGINNVNMPFESKYLQDLKKNSVSSRQISKKNMYVSKLNSRSQIKNKTNIGHRKKDNWLRTMKKIDTTGNKITNINEIANT